MSTKKCIVHQCRVIHEKSSDKENGITLFGVPKNFVEKWKDAIRNGKLSCLILTLSVSHLEMYYNTIQIKRNNKLFY